MPNQRGQSVQRTSALLIDVAIQFAQAHQSPTARPVTLHQPRKWRRLLGEKRLKRLVEMLTNQVARGRRGDFPNHAFGRNPDVFTTPADLIETMPAFDRGQAFW